MAFIDLIIERARRDPKTIVFPEAEDERTLYAAVEIVDRGIGKPILVGDPAHVASKLRELGLSMELAVVSPSQAERLEPFATEFCAMRKAKGMTEDTARRLMQEPIHHGLMMVHKGMADGLVAGAIHSTGDTLRPALQILRMARGVKLVSSFFFMVCGDRTYIFADAGLVEDPNADQLAEIALATAQSAQGFGIEPTVAMLSYSTKGSADSPLTRKVVEATKLAQSRIAERFGPGSPVQIDGELQADAALVEAVGKRKAPASPVAGRARVLIFPNLDAGNIAYKLVQRLGGADAYGPIVQGMRLPVNDLSRGCTAEDIVGVAAVTVVQSQMRAVAGTAAVSR
ncbi:MAG: phosphate acetyltransferase [Candidatus Hydrogenedentes bacterium]|nr:phosphate acetyltransferase [Candidatus Hydrogenedentota bacterium]